MDERVVGIDLGTTNSLVAFMQGEKPVVIPGEDGVNLVPSVVAHGLRWWLATARALLCWVRQSVRSTL
jgi:actin-like ATPase involved in cell morphogenesis